MACGSGARKDTTIGILVMGVFGVVFVLGFPWLMRGMIYIAGYYQWVLE